VTDEDLLTAFPPLMGPISSRKSNRTTKPIILGARLKKSLLTAFVILFSFSAFAERSLDQVKELRVMAYNTENFFLHLGADAKEPLDVFKKRVDSELKTDAQMQAEARAIKDENPDLIVVEEMENLETLQSFDDQYLGGVYKAFLTVGNDQRGINIGFLVKKDLPLQVTLETHKDETWVDPTSGATEKLFSRDAPALLVRREGDRADSTPALIFIGNHAKSQRDRPNDPKSTIMRTAQMKAIASLVSDYEKQYGSQTPIIVGGDFNNDVRNCPEVQPIRDTMVDAFDAKGITGIARMTHSFHPRSGGPSYHQLDALFVTPGLKGDIESMEAYRYKDAQGQPLPLPQTFEERSRNPSDHFPILMTLSTQEIFPEAFK
jgi:hypothetical protein